MLLFVCMFVRVRKCRRKFYPLCVLWLPEEISALVAALWCWHDIQTSARTHTHTLTVRVSHLLFLGTSMGKKLPKRKSTREVQGTCTLFPRRPPWPVSLCTCDQFLHRAWPQGAPDSCVQSRWWVKSDEHWRRWAWRRSQCSSVFILYRC